MPFSSLLGRHSKGLSGSKIALKYFALGPIGGRGSVVRYMLYVHDVDFEDVKVTPGESFKSGLKQELITSGDNPCGQLPVLYINDKPLFGHIPILRYLASKLNAVSKDDEVRQMSDVILDEYTNWRADWGASLFNEEKKKVYIAKRDQLYGLMEKLYTMRKDKSTPFFMALDKPGYDDLCVYAMIYDDHQLGGEMDMTGYPTLKELYERVKATPKIAEWIKQASSGGSSGN